MVFFVRTGPTNANAGYASNHPHFLLCYRFTLRLNETITHVGYKVVKVFTRISELVYFRRH